MARPTTATGRDPEQADRAWAKDNGHRIVKVFTDEGVSGTTPVTDRPGSSA